MKRRKHALARLLTFAVVLMLTMVLTAPTVLAATPDQIEQAINKGLAFLEAQQYPDGHWGDYAQVSHTGLAVLKFETHAIFMGMSPFDPGYAYHQVVEDGLGYIFSQLEEIPIAAQPGGDPDTNGNGIGVRAAAWDSFHYTYESAIALMAISASNEPAMMVGVGSQTGRTFAEVAQDIVDYLAFGQNEAGIPQQGSWGYDENYGWGDNSNSGYAALSLSFAEAPSPYGFGLPIPGFVFPELEIWANYIQNTTGVNGVDPHGGSGYDGPEDWWQNVLKTGNLLQQMSMIGYTTVTDRVQWAVNYIERHWNDANQDPGWNGGPGNVSYQACFTLMKGFQSLGIELIDTDGDTVRDESWYEEMADVIVATQNADGSWPADAWGSPLLSTAWAMLTLEKVAPPALSLLPPFDTNPPGTDHTVTALYKIAGVAQQGVQIDFEVIAGGPNTGKTGSDTTDANGEATFTYTGDGGIGTDTIEARAIDSQTGAVLISSQATKVWETIVSPQVPGITGWGIVVTAVMMAVLIPLALRRRVFAGSR